MKDILESLKPLMLICPPKEKGGKVFITPYMAVLRDARYLSGRDVKNGKKIKNIDHGSWLGALGYLIAIDIIGSWYVFGEINNENDFLYALKNTTDLDDKSRYALYAFRCSFAHNFALRNIPNKNEKDAKKIELLRVCFTVSQGKGLLIKHSQKPWDGEELSEDSTTLVNLEVLGDLVEKIHRQLLKMGIEDKLKLSYKGELACKTRITYKK